MTSSIEDAHINHTYIMSFWNCYSYLWWS